MVCQEAGTLQEEGGVWKHPLKYADMSCVFGMANIGIGGPSGFLMKVGRKWDEVVFFFNL